MSEKRPKYGGRKKGSTNKVNSSIKESFQLLIEDNLTQLNEDIKSLEPKDRITAILHLSKFIVPTLKAVDQTTYSEQESPKINIILGNGIEPKEDAPGEMNVVFTSGAKTEN